MHSKEISQISSGKRILLGTIAVIIATVIYLPIVHLFYASDTEPYFSKDTLSPKARLLAARHLCLWTDPNLRNQEIQKMRASNAEWDFMGRSFLVWSLANMSLRNPTSKEDYLKVIDLIIEETLRLEEQKGLYHFLMPYAKLQKFILEPPRSQFLDGEIALMLAVRRVIEEKENYKPLLTNRVNLMVKRMNQRPVMLAESYPNECWIFCNAISLAAIKIADYLDGSNHSDFLRKWLKTAKKKLIDPETGLLVSSCTVSGTWIDGPEGSSIWMISHCLKLIDKAFASNQFVRAKKELACNVLGFGYAREWPESWEGYIDIDSGPIIPILGVSPGSSGLAFVGASSFGDTEYLSRLLASLKLGGFPSERNETLKYCASNQVGDAVLLYSMTLGPIWQKVKEGKKP